MTGYSKASSAAAISPNDNVNVAAGKLEKKVDDNASSISTQGSSIASLQAAVGIWTTVQSKLVGDTSATFLNANIHTTSDIDARCENSSGTPIPVTSYTVTEGQCIIAFNALTEATSFKLWIRNL